jgi:alanine racemase
MASNEEFSKRQIAELKKASENFPDIKYVHIQNTLGAIKYDVDFCNMVRIGIGQFGYLAGRREASLYGQKLKPALRLEARVLQYKENFDGPIGYDLTENVTGNIATIRMGYHDGLLRCFQGYKFNSGAKIVGLICMCQAMLKVEHDSEYIEIFGEEENIYSLLKYGKISTYEFLVSLSARVDKIEVNDE